MSYANATQSIKAAHSSLQSDSEVTARSERLSNSSDPYRHCPSKVVRGISKIYVAVKMIKISACMHSILTGNTYIIRRENQYLFGNMCYIVHGIWSLRFLITLNLSNSIYHHQVRNAQNVRNHQLSYTSPHILMLLSLKLSCILHQFGHYQTRHYLRCNIPLLFEHNHLKDK